MVMKWEWITTVYKKMKKEKNSYICSHCKWIFRDNEYHKLEDYEFCPGCSRKIIIEKEV